jgi:nitronate monooxygenase
MNKIMLHELLDIEYPIIMAPMFLVSNTDMVLAALENGITGAIPALNYRNDQGLREAILFLKERSSKAFGINLIVNKSNIYLKRQLQACLDLEVPYIIASLGSPKHIIEVCHSKGIKVFCDVIHKEHAQKCEALGADAIIAVNSKAGGHCGNIPPEELIPQLNEFVKIPVISAGGVATKKEFKHIMDLGAAGISVGTIFIASTEAPVNDAYKQALIDYKASDIVLSTKLSGTPCTVINTPYVQSIGTKENLLEKLIHRNRKLKKYAKLLISRIGMSKLRKSAFSANYNNVWCAGPTIEHVHAIRPVKEIVGDLIK